MGELGHSCIPYINDSFIMATSEVECLETVTLLTNMLQSLGFTINREKSQLKPATVIMFLGFEINSRDMIVSLTLEKKEKLTDLGREVLNSIYIKIRDAAGLLGLMIACMPGVKYGAAHWKAIERDQIKALRRAKGD